MTRRMSSRTLGPIFLGLVLSVALSVGCTNTDTTVAAHTTVDDFRLIDHNGRSQWLGALIDEAEVFYVAIDLECGTDQALALMQSIRTAHPKAKVYYIAANPKQERKAYKTLIKASEKRAPVLMDTSLTISASLGLKTVASAVKVRPQDGHITPFKQGLSECPVRKVEPSAVDFKADILPIIDKHCLSCHTTSRWVKIFKDYPTVRGWSQMIRQTLRTQRMPPGGIDPHFRPYVGVAKAEDMDALLQWVEMGMPKSGHPDPFPKMNHDKIVALNNPKGWGKPDIVWEMPEAHIVPASGPDIYKYIQIAGPTKRDIHLNRIRFNADFRVTHHMNLMVLDRPLKALSDDQVFSKGNDQQMRVRKITATKGEMYHDHPTEPSLKVAHKLFEETILMTASRSQALSAELDLGAHRSMLIPKGSYILLEGHYGSTGKEGSNKAVIKIYEHPNPSESEVVERGCLYRGGFKIPPGKPSFTMKTAVDIDEDILLVRFVPHMHARGKAVTYFATGPNKERKVLLSVPNFQYKYQHEWTPEEPIFIPKGTRLETHMVYDNSKYNPINPDPTQWVYNGSSRAEEMHLPRFQFVRLDKDKDQ